MRLILDAEHRITGYTLIGNADGSTDVELDKKTEKNLLDNFEAGKFIFKNGEIVEDGNYKGEASRVIPQFDPTQQALGTLIKQVADVTKQNVQLQQSLGALALQLAKEEK